MPTTPGPAPDDGSGADPDPRLGPLVGSLAARLGGVCRAWDAGDFAAFVMRVARRQLHWADRADGVPNLAAGTPARWESAHLGSARTVRTDHVGA